MIIWGTKGRISPHSNSDVLEKACPECSHDLKLSNLKRWFTLYFIPVFPYSTVDTFYYCKKCESSFKQEAREALLSSGENKDQLLEQARKIMAVSLVSCLVYMSQVDGSVDSSEQKLIDETINEFERLQGELREIAHTISQRDDARDVVHHNLRTASEILTSEAILVMMAEVAKMVLADGSIDEAEEKLMKEFLLVAGLPSETYALMMDKVKN